MLKVQVQTPIMICHRIIQSPGVIAAEKHRAQTPITISRSSVQSPGVIAAEKHRTQTPITISRSSVQSPGVIVAEKHRGKTAIIMCSNVIQSPAVTGSHSVLVSVRLQVGRSWVQIPSETCGIFQPWPAPTQSWECYGPSGKGWNHTAKLHPLHRCVFESVAVITWPTLQVPQFLGLVNIRIIITLTVSLVCSPVSK